jgi:cytochrome c
VPRHSRHPWGQRHGGAAARWWAERGYIAGALPNRPGNLVAWLMNPQAIEPGTAMPDLSISEQEALDMSAYLYSLR